VLNHIRITTYFLAETLKASRTWNDVCQALKENKNKNKKTPCQPRLYQSYPSESKEK
jgi:hypothetical protein